MYVRNNKYINKFRIVEDGQSRGLKKVIMIILSQQQRYETLVRQEHE